MSINPGGYHSRPRQKARERGEEEEEVLYRLLWTRIEIRFSKLCIPNQFASPRYELGRRTLERIGDGSFYSSGRSSSDQRQRGRFILRNIASVLCHVEQRWEGMD